LAFDTCDIIQTDLVTVKNAKSFDVKLWLEIFITIIDFVIATGGTFSHECDLIHFI
jgi:hypothetical protein